MAASIWLLTQGKTSCNDERCLFLTSTEKEERKHKSPTAEKNKALGEGYFMKNKTTSEYNGLLPELKMNDWSLTIAIFIKFDVFSFHH